MDSHMDYGDTFTLTLRKPVQLGGTDYTVLELSEPTCGELIKAGKAGTPLEQLAALIQFNAKVPMAVVTQLGQRDLEAAGDFFGHFSSAMPSDSLT